MKGRPRTLQLTEAGYRITDLMRAGFVSKNGPRRSAKRHDVDRPTCPVCEWWVPLTPVGLVGYHRVAGQQCPGTGRQVTR